MVVFAPQAPIAFSRVGGAIDSGPRPRPPGPADVIEATAENRAFVLQAKKLSECPGGPHQLSSLPFDRFRVTRYT